MGLRGVGPESGRGVLAADGDLDSLFEKWGGEGRETGTRSGDRDGGGGDAGRRAKNIE